MLVPALHTTRIYTDRAVGLGRSYLQAGTIGAISEAGAALSEGVDYSVDLRSGDVLALREIEGLIRFVFTYDDRSEVIAAEEAADAALQTDFSSAWAAARDRLDQIQSQAATIRTQAQALEAITLSGTQAQQSAQIQAALRQIGQGIRLMADMHTDEAAMIRRAGKLVGRRLADMPRSAIDP